MKNVVNRNIAIENAQICFRNFSGKEGQYNAAGRRNFCVLLNEDDAAELKEEGWNVRWLSPREEGDDPQAYIQVTVSYDHIPPKIVLINSRGKTTLDEDTVNILDWAEISSVDIVIRPYNWTMGSKTGVKAYVKNMYVTIAEDEFAKKYYDTPDSAIDSIIE